MSFAYGCLTRAHSVAQQTPLASCNVPVVVTRFVSSSRSVELVKDLGPRDFTAQLGTAPGVIAAASIDSGPKRIALILDTSSSIPEDEWKLETAMAVQLLRQARSRDTFYLFFVGMDNTTTAPLSAKEAEGKIQEAASTDLYAGLAEPYRLSIPVANSSDQIGLLIGVTNFKDRGINERDVHFPRFVYPCRPQ
jgi:hypothetical protein